jgi:quinol monooxygenase YgiN
MPSVIANIKVKEDKVEEAKAFFKQLAADTLANEEGTLEYIAHQRKDDPTAFVFYEKYSDDAAFAIHGKNLASKGKEFAGMMAGPPEIFLVDEI